MDCLCREKNQNDPKILRKYRWFANFHNKIVNEIIAAHKNNPAFKIQTEELEAVIIDIPTVYQIGLPEWAIPNQKRMPGKGVDSN